MLRLIFYMFLILFTTACSAALYLAFTHSSKQELELIDPQESKDPLVLKGFSLMELTPKMAPDFAGDRITCSNCHFNGGNTQGGENNGISLVGVTAEYPRYSSRSGTSITLAERIGNCFERSLNGKAPDADDPVITALIAYLDWISQPALGIKEKKWLGLKPLKTKHVPDEAQGKIEYEKHCALCHKKDGSGSVDEEGDSIPPVFGPYSFNDGAGMNNPATFASFIYLNMPQGEPYLTEEQALDIAAYVTKQPRPHLQNGKP